VWIDQELPENWDISDYEMDPPDTCLTIGMNAVCGQDATVPVYNALNDELAWLCTSHCGRLCDARDHLILIDDDERDDDVSLAHI